MTDQILQNITGVQLCGSEVIFLLMIFFISSGGAEEVKCFTMKTSSSGVELHFDVLNRISVFWILITVKMEWLPRWALNEKHAGIHSLFCCKRLAVKDPESADRCGSHRGLQRVPTTNKSLSFPQFRAGRCGRPVGYITESRWRRAKTEGEPAYKHTHTLIYSPLCSEHCDDPAACRLEALSCTSLLKIK